MRGRKRQLKKNRKKILESLKVTPDVYVRAAKAGMEAREDAARAKEEVRRQMRAFFGNGGQRGRGDDKCLIN